MAPAHHPYEDIATDIIQIVDWENLGIPKGHGALPIFKELGKRLWLDSSKDIINLYTISICLCVYDFLDKARRVGLALTPIPNGGPAWYMYVNTCIVLPCCFLERAGQIDEAYPLRQIAIDPPGEPYRPRPLALDGSMLNNFFSNPEYDPKWHADWTMSDITTLSYMWVYGSPVPEWTREKISHMIDVNLNELLSIKKWRTWR